MRRIIESRIGTFLLALLFVALLTSIASACPNCKDAMEKQDPTHGGMVKGYFYSILFMMGTPYLVFGSFCALMYYRVRRARLTGQTKRPLAGAATANRVDRAPETQGEPREPAGIARPQPLEV